MKVLVDGDSCSIIHQIEKIAKGYGLPVVIFADMQRCIHNEYSTVHYVLPGKDAADKAIINNLDKNDIVVTADYALAALVLSKCGKCIHPHGFIYTDENILSLLKKKYLIRKMLRKHPKKKVKGYNVGPKMHCNFNRSFPVLIEESIKNDQVAYKEEEKCKKIIKMGSNIF